MIKLHCFLVSLLATLSFIVQTPVAHGRVLDDFNDNTKTDWQDFSFIDGFGLPTEADGQFQFVLPPAGQAIFTASRKTSEEFELKNGRTIEFKVDLVDGNGKDSFAVLAFIPTTNSLGTLAGYGLAKSTTDILLTKGIGKYFYNKNVSPAVKNNNVTLVLTLTAQDDSVTINGKVLDKDDGDAVIWEQTVIDTPAADILANGVDDPAIPYLTHGHFALYCYEDFDNQAPQADYRVTFDNAAVCVLEESVLDNFDDNTKTDWSDFTFITGLGLPEEVNGQFQFTLPPAGQALFTASRKTSRVFDLRECDHLQFRVDLVNGVDKDSFAVLAFIPETNSLGTLAGYGIAKSTTDLLLTKGVGKYFYNENVSPPVKNANVTLVLDLTVSNATTVHIKGQVLDKDDSNRVIWEQVAVDTPDADILSNGTDDPALPYITTGHFALYCYEDFDPSAPQAVYQVIYDNASVMAPAVSANQPPQISEISPAETANFVDAATARIAFKASDDQPLVDANISVRLNGTTYRSTNGLALTGTGNTRNVTLAGLKANVDYTAELEVIDASNATNRVILHFDTFARGNLVIESEDYNFSSGQFIDDAALAPEGSAPAIDSYNNQTGMVGVDYTDSRGSPNGTDTKFRNNDSVRMQHSLDLLRQNYIDFGGAAAGIYDYDVGDIVAGEWLNYSRTFTPGSYLVYLRESVVNTAQAEAALELVTSDPTQPDQQTTVLGSFIGRTTGFQYRNVLLTDPSGHPAILRLHDVETLRLRQVTTTPGDGIVSQNYLIFVPTDDPGLQRCRVVSASPTDGSTVASVRPALSATIQNFDTAVLPESIKLKLNGAPVTPEVASTFTAATVTFALTPLPPSGVVNTAQLTFEDDLGVTQVYTWSFTVTYRFLNPTNRANVAGSSRGFAVRMVQAPGGSGLDNSLTRAESQLSIPSPIAVFIDTNTTADVINMDKRPSRNSGYFPNDNLVPGLFDENQNSLGNGDNDFTVESVAWLDLPAGVYTFGARTDDGYKCSSGTALHDSGSSALLGFHNGGPADETFEFVVVEPGLYPFRFLWYESGGDGFGEFFSVKSTGEKVLINDPNSPDAIKAYLTAGKIVLQSAPDVTGPFTEDVSATLAGDGQFTLPAPSARRFYRIRAETAYRIRSLQIVGGNLQLLFGPAPPAAAARR